MKKIFSPIIKALFSIISIFITGILSSALVVEITSKNGEINWKNATQSRTFYYILIYILIFVLFNILSAANERNYLKKINEVFFKEFLEKEGFSELANQAIDAVQKCDTHKLKEVTDIKKMIEGMLNEKNNDK